GGGGKGEGGGARPPHPVGGAVGILQGDRLPDHVRRRHRHAVSDRRHGVLDVAQVGSESHADHPGERAVESGLKLRCRRPRRALRTWKPTRRRNAATPTTATANSTQRTAGTPAGNTTIHAAVPRKFTIAIGTSYFQH